MLGAIRATESCGGAMSGRRRSSRSDARSRALVRAWRFLGAVALAVLAVPGAQGQTDTTATTSTTTHASAGCPPHVEISVTTSVTIGPATILVGENQSQVFFVAAGTTNVNTNTHTEIFVCVPAAVPALSSPALGALASLLSMLAVPALRTRRRANRSSGRETVARR